jgi:hypothetical protein
MTNSVAFRRTVKLIDKKFEEAKQNEPLCKFCEFLQMTVLMTLPLALPFIIILLELRY